MHNFLKLKMYELLLPEASRLKGTVQPKMNMSSLFTYTQVLPSFVEHKIRHCEECWKPAATDMHSRKMYFSQHASKYLPLCSNLNMLI